MMSLSDEEVNSSAKGKLGSIGKDNPIGLEEKAENTKSKERAESVIESRTASSLFSPQVSARSQNTQKKRDGAYGNNVVSGARQGYLSPTPKNSANNMTKSGKISTPTSSLSQDTVTLAQLYHSSRRSRHSHSPHGGLSKSVTISPQILPPPLISSKSMDDAMMTSPHNEAWPFNIASSIGKSCPSSNSISSIESEDFMATHEFVTASEFFGEEDNIENEQKRRKISPEE
mmetsp:Transcript_14582/g.22100  ORF Transcript_14582/g.22100 Transcript_14582/m.22100 type:complete len:230 (+) Transcript_14582:64-753(+)